MVPTSNRSPVSPMSAAASAVKSTLARLLATENISVQHQNIPTAFFDLKTRSLHLPLWSNASGSLYDMLVGHEVAHALFTPVDGWRTAIDSVAAATGCSKDTAKQYLNIVEDARIERMIQAKFRGLKADFISAYKTLMERQFFGDLSNIGDAIFADRFNIYFKCGVHAGTAVKFSTEEAAFVTRGEQTATWADVVALAQDMIVFAQEQTAKTQDQGDQPQPTDDQEQGEDGESMPIASEDGEDADGEDGEGQSTDTSESGESQSDNGSASGEDGEDADGEEQDGNADGGKGNGSGQGKADSAAPTKEPQQSGNGGDDGIAPSTNRSLEEQLKTLAGTDDAAPARVVRVAVPNSDSSAVVIPFTRIIADLSATGFASFMKTPVKIADYTAATNMMATAFNRKKAADVFRRSTVAKSGSLDTLRMNQYKWTDDIFRKTTRIAEGKNHGIVILLDWSGSMNHIMQSTIGQLLILTDFCRKVGVPFEVYAFSNTPYYDTVGPKFGTDEYYAEIERRNAEKEAKRGEVAMCDMHLLNFLSSRMNAAQYETMKSSLWNWRNMSNFDSRYAMNSTPTNSALVYASDIVAKFQAATRVQIMHTVVLTDGEPTDNFEFSLSRWMRKQGESEAAQNLSWRDSYRTAVVMSDPITGASYDICRVNRKDGGDYTYGNVVFNTSQNAYYARDQYTTRIALDILRRRTGTKIHWIGLTTGKRVTPESYQMVSKTANYKRDGFIRGTVAGWDSAVVVNAERFLRNGDGSVANTAQKVLDDAEDRMDAAKSKRELQSAFIESQIAAGSLRTVASIVGEYLAV